MRYTQLLHTDYKICGQHLTCLDIVSKPGPGCYCKEGYRLNITSGRCEKASECPPINPFKSLDLSECDRFIIMMTLYVVFSNDNIIWKDFTDGFNCILFT